MKYTQNSVSQYFYDGSSIFSGRYLNIPIQVTEYRGDIWILNNRTALAKEFSGAKRTWVEFVPYKKCKYIFHRKLSTENGEQPRIRGYVSNDDSDTEESSAEYDTESDEYDSESSFDEDYSCYNRGNW